ncbi:hypothetical protein RCC89_14565 [Cytophagaceae bacterium ABcell3]|nr:hypothetical protein RCC89_14565 [Cytophagaceae bacterium ABcell3]
MMTPYSSRSGKKSGVTAYCIGDDFIVLRFRNFKEYTYTYKSAGRHAVEKMKKMALEQKGLCSYVSINKPRYERPSYFV